MAGPTFVDVGCGGRVLPAQRRITHLDRQSKFPIDDSSACLSVPASSNTSPREEEDSQVKQTGLASPFDFCACRADFSLFEAATLARVPPEGREWSIADLVQRGKPSSASDKEGSRR